jgi:hypothetical protein
VGDGKGVFFTLFADTRMDLARLMPFEWSSFIVERKVIWRRPMMSWRRSLQRAIAKPRITFRTRTDRQMVTATEMMVITMTGQVFWTK